MTGSPLQFALRCVATEYPFGFLCMIPLLPGFVNFGDLYKPHTPSLAFIAYCVHCSFLFVCCITYPRMRYPSVSCAVHMHHVLVLPVEIQGNIRPI